MLEQSGLADLSGSCQQDSFAVFRPPVNNLFNMSFNGIHGALLLANPKLYFIIAVSSMLSRAKPAFSHYKSLLCRTAMPTIENAMPVTINTAMFLTLQSWYIRNWSDIQNST